MTSLIGTTSFVGVWLAIYRTARLASRLAADLLTRLVAGVTKGRLLDPLRTTLCATVTPERIQLCVLRGGRIVWADEEALATVEVPAGVAGCLTRLIHQARSVDSRTMSIVRRRWRLTPRVYVALAATHVRVKRLVGLPEPCTLDLLTAIVREGVSRFFLVTGTRTTHVAVHRDDSGDVWGAAYDADIVASAIQGCSDAGVRLRCMAPMPIASATPAGGYPSPAIASMSVQPALQVDDDRSASWERAAGSGSWPSGASDILALATSPLALVPGVSPSFASSDAPRISAVAWTALVSLGAFGVLPGLAAHAAGARLDADLHAAAPALARAASLHAELIAVSGQLEEGAEFAAGRRSMTATLSRLSDALPDGIVAVSLKLGETDGSIAVVGQDVVTATTALEALPLVDRATIAGAITREPPAPQYSTAPAPDPDGIMTTPALSRERATILLSLRPIGSRQEGGAPSKSRSSAATRRP